MKTLRAGAFMWLAACISFSLFISGCGDAKYVRRTSTDPDKQEQLDWNYQTTVDVYQKSQYKSFRWNQHAVTALAEFSCYKTGVGTNGEPCAKIIGDNAAAAVKSGCKDPMVNYLYIKFGMSQTNTPAAFADAFKETADNMQGSPYPRIRQFYASLRAAEQMHYAEGDGSQVSAEVHQYRRQAMQNLADALHDANIPISEVDDACRAMLGVINQNQKQYDEFYSSVEDLLFKNWPDEEAVWLLKAEAYYKKAWFARGGGYADKVTQDGWIIFRNDLGIAETAAKKAWSLNPNDARTPAFMIRIDEGQQKDRSDMELWFNRAMQLDPNDYEACSSKLHYLYPQWYGSREDMLAFGRECVANTNWGGHVPLILMDAHREYQMYLPDSDEKNNYWKQPDVWPDLKSAFDRFFELNPDAAGWHYNYAWYAYACGQWNDFLHQTTLLGSITNYDYFGGKKSFDDMLETARENSGK